MAFYFYLFFQAWQKGEQTEARAARGELRDIAKARREEEQHVITVESHAERKQQREKIIFIIIINYIFI